MPNLVYAVPKPRQHQTGQSVVTISGRDVYLGKHGTQAAKQRYDRLIVEWLANGRTLLPSHGETTVVEVAAAYKLFAKSYYVKNGKVTREYGCLKDVLLILDQLYGRTPANEFGPLKLQAVRQALIDRGWTRKYINKQVGRIVRMFKWATERELIVTDVYQRLIAVSGLRQGRTIAPDRPPRAAIFNRRQQFSSSNGTLLTWHRKHLFWASQAVDRVSIHSCRDGTSTMRSRFRPRRLLNCRFAIM